MSVEAEQQEQGTAMRAGELIAHVHHRQALLTKVFDRWSQQREEMAAKRRRNELISANIHATKLRFVFFRAWQWKYNQRAAQRDDEEAAKEHWLRQRLVGWRRVTTAARERRRRISRWVAEKPAVVARQQQVFTEWQRCARHRVVLKTLQFKTSATVAYGVLYRWREYARSGQCRRRMRVFTANVLCAKVGSTSCHWSLRPQSALASPARNPSESFSVIPFGHLALSFHTWMLAAKAKRLRRRRCNDALVGVLQQGNQALLARRYFVTLRRFRAVRVLVRSTGVALLQQTMRRLVLNRALAIRDRVHDESADMLRRGAILRRWSHRMRESQQARQNEEVAEAHGHQKALSKAMKGWKQVANHEKFVREGVNDALHNKRPAMLKRQAVVQLLSPIVGRQLVLHGGSKSELPSIQPAAGASSSTPRPTSESPEQMTQFSTPKTASRARPRPIPFRPFVDPMSGAVVAPGITSSETGAGEAAPSASKSFQSPSPQRQTGDREHWSSGGHTAAAARSPAPFEAVSPVAFTPSRPSPLNGITAESVTSVMDQYLALMKTKESDEEELASLRNGVVELRAAVTAGADAAGRIAAEKQLAIETKRLDALRDRQQMLLSLRTRLTQMVPELTKAAGLA